MSQTAPEPGPAPPPGDRCSLYVPATGERQLTLRAVASGCAIGGVVSAMNIYMGLRVGWSFGGSLIAAILGFGAFTLLRPKHRYTVLETNITQTAGSAAGSMASAAGLLAPIPALGMLGKTFSLTELLLWAFSVAYLGICFAVPLRRQLVVLERLRFPTGTATAETIVAMFAASTEAVRKARTLLLAALVAGVFTLASFFVPVLEKPLGAVSTGWCAVLSGLTITLLLSPMMTGAGILIGPRVGTSLLAGAVVAWGLLAPWVQRVGVAPGKILAYSDGARGWLLWPGVTLMVVSGLTSLTLSWRSFVRTFRTASTIVGEEREAERQRGEGIPQKWWVGLLCIAALATIAVSRWVFEVPVLFSFLGIAVSAVLATVAVRSTGETDINPVGGMGKVTQLLFGGLAPGAVNTNLMAAAITGAGASQAADMMQDLKTGHLIGASPRQQFVAQTIGIAGGALVCVPIFKLFESAYEIGGTRIPAPAAHAWRAMAVLLSQGLSALPPGVEWALVGAALVGAALAVAAKIWPGRAPYLPSALALGIAFIVPAYYSIAMFLGSLLLVVWQRLRPASAAAFAFAMASGLIAGEGLMGVCNAVLTLLGVQSAGGS